MCHSALCLHIQPCSINATFRVRNPVCVTGRTKEIIPIIYRPSTHSAFSRVRLSGFPALMYPLAATFEFCLPFSLALWSITGRAAVLGMCNIRSAVYTESLWQFGGTPSFDPSPLVVALTTHIPRFSRECLYWFWFATLSAYFKFSFIHESRFHIVYIHSIHSRNH
jgi:hypothetical protein